VTPNAYRVIHTPRWTSKPHATGLWRGKRRGLAARFAWKSYRRLSRREGVSLIDRRCEACRAATKPDEVAESNYERSRYAKCSATGIRRNATCERDFSLRERTSRYLTSPSSGKVSLRSCRFATEEIPKWSFSAQRRCRRETEGSTSGCKIVVSAEIPRCIRCADAPSAIRTGTARRLYNRADVANESIGKYRDNKIKSDVGKGRNGKYQNGAPLDSAGGIYRLKMSPNLLFHLYERVAVAERN